VKPQRDEPIVIELDDPPPRGAKFIGLAIGILIIALLMAPFILDRLTTPDDIDATQTPLATRNEQICQPDVDLPSVLDPMTNFALPSWMRLCDWFSPPQDQPVDRPPNT